MYQAAIGFALPQLQGDFMIGMIQYLRNPYKHRERKDI
jgi:hypothetical protein